MKTYRSEGRRVKWTNGTGLTVAGGDVIVLGALLAIAVVDIIDGASGMVEIGGEHELLATSAEDWDQGDHLWLNPSTAMLTDTVQPGYYAGVAAKAKAALALTACVVLNGGAESAKAADNVAALGAITSAAPAAMTAAPAALTAADPTLDAADVDDQSGGTPSAEHELADCATGDWDTEKADVENNFSTLAAEYNGLKDDTEALETSLEAAIDDLGSQKTQFDKLITDTTAARAEVVKLVADATAAFAKVNAEIAALKAAGLQKTA
ncbi:MAG TPA: capsid cement protein [Phycisphaerae bacterium]|nr:capsid cement protein [Phycisphaerae bacterium]